MSTNNIITLESVKRFLAAPFSKEYGDFLRGNKIEDRAARAIARHTGTLPLGALTELTDAAADALATHQGGALDLGGLTELSDIAAEAFSRYQGDLNLNGLTALSDAAARALSNHKGGLNLQGVKKLSDAAANALSRHKEELWLTGLTDLSTGDITGLSCAGAQAFDGHPMLRLDYTRFSPTAKPAKLRQKIQEDILKKAEEDTGLNLRF